MCIVEPTVKSIKVVWTVTSYVIQLVSNNWAKERGCLQCQCGLVVFSVLLAVAVVGADWVDISHIENGRWANTYLCRMTATVWRIEDGKEPGVGDSKDGEMGAPSLQFFLDAWSSSDPSSTRLRFFSPWVVFPFSSFELKRCDVSTRIGFGNFTSLPGTTRLPMRNSGLVGP